VIAARLDRLDESTKATAQTAAVVGREFQHAVLVEVSDARRRWKPRSSRSSGASWYARRAARRRQFYSFKHALTQETAYGTILMSKRRVLHKRVAECLERTDPEQVNDIARHFMEAQENRARAAYLVQAGERAPIRRLKPLDTLRARSSYWSMWSI